jgi:HK97 family phage major capsid protein
MNTAQIEAEAKEIDRLLSEAVDAKSYGELDALAKRVDNLAQARKDLDRPIDPRIAAVAMYGGDLAASPEVTTKATGAHVSPMAFSDASLQKMFNAFKDRQPLSIKAEVATKAFSTVDSLLPAQLDPQVVGHIHEWRILDRLPMITINAPSYEFIVHNFSGDTGAPAIVAEGGTKPEYLPDATSSIATVVKIAMNTGISYETLADWPQWLSYVQTECFRQMWDKENALLLNGSSGLVGFFQTSGILTHDCTADPGSYTAIDSIEAAITQMRIGTSLSEPGLFITSPQAWAAIRRIKTTTDAYVVGDPLRSPVSTLWGVPVLITTAMPSTSQGLLVDTTKFGRALLREGIVMHQGFANADFVNNIARYVFEERLTLAVERPQAVLAISNLPTS